MSRSKNILVVILAICVVLTAGIVHVVVILGGIGEAPAEWKDYFVLNGVRYFNSYNLIDASYAETAVGKITSSVPRGADASAYEAKEGEAVYLSVGTQVYNVKGFDESKYVAALDNGEYFLYCSDGCSPTEVIAECGIKVLRREIGFKSYFLDTVCDENSDYGVRISVVRTKNELSEYLARYVNDFRVSEDSFTYDPFFEDKTYNDLFFKSGRLIIVRLPEDDGKVVYELDSITSDELKTTLQLTENCLPQNVSYDKCTVRHMLVEVSAGDYTDQTISYQIERQYIHLDEDSVNSPDEFSDEPENEFVFTFVKNRAQAFGTVYETLVTAQYDREFFDTNSLLIVRCVDEERLYDYSYDETKLDESLGTVVLSRTPASDKDDPSVDYFVVSLPKASLEDRLFIPCVVDGEEPDAPNDPDGAPEEMTPRDLLVIGDLESFEQIDAVYNIGSEIYNEDFFENYVLFFAGYLTSSPEIEVAYSSITNEDGAIELTVTVSAADECTFAPAFKYVAVPFLKSEYNGETLSVHVAPKGTEETGETEVTDETAEIAETEALTEAISP